MNMSIPVYDLVFDEELMKGVYAVSLVNNPAIEIQAMKFSEDIKVLEWKMASQEKRILVSPVLIPNQLIYRQNINGMEGYVRMSAEVIEQLKENFAKKGYQNNSTLEHNEEIQGVTFTESWTIEDPNNDKANALGYKNLPKGTWCLTAKLSQELWDDYVKTNKITGFSIEAILQPVLSINNEINLNKQNMEKDLIKQLVIEAMGEIKLAEQSTEVVEIKMKYDIEDKFYTDSFEMGSIVYNMDESIAANIEFEYEGKVYKTDENGAIMSIEDKVMEEADVEVEMAEGDVVEDSISVETQKMLDEKDAKIAELEAKVQQLEAELTVKAEEAIIMSKEIPASSGIKDTPIEMKSQEPVGKETLIQMMQRLSGK